MAKEECTKIMNALIVDEKGELVIDESFRQHLDECPQCRAIYENIRSAKAEAMPDYVSAAMQRLDEDCTEIIEGLAVDAKGQLVLEKSFREHLDECAHCREIYKNIEAAKREKVPDYVPGVMQKIREMEELSSSSRWREQLRNFLSTPITFRPRVLLPSVAIIAIALIVALTSLHILPGRSQLDEYADLVDIDRDLSEFADIDKRIDMALDEHINRQIGLFQEDLQDMQ